MTISVRVFAYLSINVRASRARPPRGAPPHPRGGKGKGRDLWNDADRDISRFRRPPMLLLLLLLPVPLLLLQLL